MRLEIHVLPRFGALRSNLRLQPLEAPIDLLEAPIDLRKPLIDPARSGPACRSPAGRPTAAALPIRWQPWLHPSRRTHAAKAMPRRTRGSLRLSLPCVALSATPRGPGFDRFMPRRVGLAARTRTGRGERRARRTSGTDSPRASSPSRRRESRRRTPPSRYRLLLSYSRSGRKPREWCGRTLLPPGDCLPRRRR